jgi:regulator of protease activity HflC (stomatin/prohibitin superfamily)
VLFSPQTAPQQNRARAFLGLGASGLVILCLFSALVWVAGSSNPFTPAGYVGYLTKGAVLGKSRFYGIQRGPTSPGRRWLLDVTNVSVTPYTFMEDFSHDDAVLSRDNLKIAFRVHTVWRLDDTRVPLFMDRYSTTVARTQIEKEPDAIVKVAYGNFIREPLRTYARDEVQRRNGLEVKDALIPIGDAVLARVQQYAQGSPFLISSVVVGNVQYPEEVATAVSRKLAATQELQRKDTEIEIERKERTKREVQAQGIANAMQIIRGQLSAMYIQHEAIEAQKQMVGSPNHTVVYIPVGPMGVPLAGTFNVTAPERNTATSPGQTNTSIPERTAQADK